MSSQTVSILVNAFEFLLSIVLAVGVVYANYRLMIKTNPDYDAEAELKKQNLGVAALLAGNLVGSGLIVRNGIYPAVGMVKLAFTAGAEAYLPLWEVAALSLAHIAIVFFVATFAISFSLRLFGRLTRNIEEGQELKKGNPAVGIVLAAVVIVVSLYVSDGVSSFTKSLIPQPSLGAVGVVRTMR